MFHVGFDARMNIYVLRFLVRSYFILEFQIPYGRERKHVLLIRKSEILHFRVLITKEFLKLNSGSVLSELKTMEEGFTSNMEKRKNLKSSQKKLNI